MSERSLLARLRRSTDPGEEARAQRLANAFEVCGAGWFWETDADGCLTYISSTFVEALGVDPKSLIGRPIIDLVAADAAAMDAGNDARSLEFHLHARLPFFEATMPVLFPVGLHWWSLSGTPIFGRGQRFQGFSGIGTDLTDVRRSEDRAQHLARFDSLTGLANRATIRETLNDIATADSDARRYALMLLDLDHFKSVNDTLGHPIGDRLLEQVADRLRAIVGVHGRVGRLGGDEFAIIATAGDAALSFGKLAASVVDFLSQPYAIDGHHITVGASVGIAMGSDQGQCVDALIRNADLALYAAKAAGRGKVRGRLAFSCKMPLADAAAAPDPFVGGIDRARELVIRDGARGKIRADSGYERLGVCGQIRRHQAWLPDRLRCSFPAAASRERDRPAPSQRFSAPQGISRHMPLKSGGFLAGKL